ncbi:MULTISPECIES: hypothetical protein [Acidihalobacter]|uniref:Uncharacterized protein n=2 Tax=Acidihalobacter TaxID=1765964 RepID=A0A1A6C2C2_9GAMM|nr:MULTISPECIES: hypothetical protein [Acidihalobacter]AOU97305.1 hypothetical protein BI364_04215 [Acidihalobacter yilgarnensis]OBS08717.1 hypothetical protein Thpro_022967 [Acidihalobacter prosperus]
MRRLGRVLAYLGAALTAIGIIAGFYYMVRGDERPAEFFFTMVPVGFLTLFTGVMTALLFGPRR